MTAEFSLELHNTAENYDLDIVFVHGLTGDPKKTWENDTGEFWPLWLVDELKSIRVHTLGYPSSLFEKFAKKEMDIYERAENALEYMVSKGVGVDKPVLFIAHSLGGLLVKQILRTAKEADNSDWNTFFEQTKMVCFLATPHIGSSLASTLKYCFPKLASSHIETLTANNGYLVDLNKSYRDFAPSGSIATIAYYEKYKTKNVALVVTQESSDPGVHQCRPIALDTDHIQICKPKNKEALMYCSLLRHIKKNVSNETVRCFDNEDYSSQSTGDRRDLLQKLIDANREHEYNLANDYQNKFAQRYIKLGLYSEEKMRSDEFLNDIEQRFVLHVYHPLICKGSSDTEISSAIQDQIIQPVCEKYKSIIDDISATTVLKALYFLTEQCFIRWDAA